MLEKTNLIGAITTIVIYVLYILMCVFRLLGLPEYGHWIASLQFLSVIPLVYVLMKAPKLGRPGLYYIQVVLMLVFLFVELMLDYVMKIEFRQTKWMVISYVTLFFAATGGLLGVVAQMEKRKWIRVALALYLIMGILAFIQRAVTGL